MQQAATRLAGQAMMHHKARQSVLEGLAKVLQSLVLISQMAYSVSKDSKRVPSKKVDAQPACSDDASSMNELMGICVSL